MALRTSIRQVSARTHARRAAFTIIELMVALTVGGLAIGSMYAIGSATTRQFYSQQQVASAQTSLRMALDQVKRDIARAGYLSTPNVTVVNGKPLQTCAAVVAPLDAPGSRLAAFSTFQNDVAIVAANNAIDPTGNNAASGFSADDIVLFANYETTDEYPGIGFVPPDTISVSASWHGFRRDFTNWSQVDGLTPPTFDAAAFAQAFPPGRLIRIQTTGKQRHFAQVVATVAPVAGVSPPFIRFTPAIPAACSGAVDGGWVAPVNAMHYFVRNATGDEAPRFVGTTGANGQLVREEVAPGNKITPFAVGGVPAVPRVILDYVVGFNLSFTMTANTAMGAPDAFAPGVFTDVAATVNANPQLIRAVRIDLAVRTPEQDPALSPLPWVPARCAGMRCFQVFADRPGASRVRRLRAEVLVPNVAIEGY
jgi:prepilin-type N-terminal cleavage/methylation domain-containing protein